MTEQNSKKIYGLLGRNISYSLSPAMHNAAFEKFDPSSKYKIFDKKPEELKSFFENEVLTGKISGLNVTVPYKIKVKEMLEENAEKWSVFIDEYVKFAQAVNTIKVEKDRIIASNTDMEGFKDSLNEDAHVSWGDKKVFIVGAGGAGRAISLFISTSGDKKEDGTWPKLTKVTDVDLDKLMDLEVLFSRFWHDEKMFVPVKTEDISKEIQDCDLVINATPLGSKEGDPMPISPDCLKKGMTVYDLVYARETELVKAAKEKGLTAVGGLGMLVSQGARSFCSWTKDNNNEWYPVSDYFNEVKNIMRKKALEELRKRKA